MACTSSNSTSCDGGREEWQQNMIAAGCRDKVVQRRVAKKGGIYKLLLVEVVESLFDNTNMERD
jgi:hypothetical protein